MLEINELTSKASMLDNLQKYNKNHSSKLTNSENHFLDVVETWNNFYESKGIIPPPLRFERLCQLPYNLHDKTLKYKIQTMRNVSCKMKKEGYVIYISKGRVLVTNKRKEDILKQKNDDKLLFEKYSQSIEKVCPKYVLPRVEYTRIKNNEYYTSDIDTGKDYLNCNTGKNNLEEFKQIQIEEKKPEPHVLAYEDGIAYIKKLEYQEASLKKPKDRVATATQVADKKPKPKECAAPQATPRVTADDVLDLLVKDGKFIFKNPFTGGLFTADPTRIRKQKHAILQASNRFSLSEICEAIKWVKSGNLHKYKGKWHDTPQWFTTASDPKISKCCYAISGKLERLVITYREYCKYVTKNISEKTRIFPKNCTTKNINNHVENQDLSIVMGSLMGSTFMKMRN